MIVAAGRGTRLRPLSNLRPKPAVPVRGIPLVGYTLALLAQHGVTEVVVNVHHDPELLEQAVARWRPPGLEVRFSREKTLLDTGGGVRRVAAFLRESDPCLLLGGDMILDTDLSALVRLHRERGDSVTLLLKEDERAARFGTIGVDEAGRVRRIARRLDLGEERAAGLWVWANVVSARAFESMPDREVFVFLDDWLGSMLRDGDPGVRAHVARSRDLLWEPVGTLPEYLTANLKSRSLSYLDSDARAVATGTRFGPNLVVGAGAELGPGVSLERAVVWDGEKVPAGFVGQDGVFAGGSFHVCEPEATP
jgi:NDP-sugar pyrophosphorylase family protein